MMNNEEEFLESLKAPTVDNAPSDFRAEVYIDESDECIKLDFIDFIEKIRDKYGKDIYLHVSPDKWRNLSSYVKQMENLNCSLPDYNDYFRIKNVSDEEFAYLD